MYSYHLEYESLALICSQARRVGQTRLARSGSTSQGGKTGADKRQGPASADPTIKIHELTLSGFSLLRGCGALLARLRFLRSLPGGLRFLLGGELLLDLGRDRGHIHLVELGGFSQCFC